MSIIIRGATQDIASNQQLGKNGQACPTRRQIFKFFIMLYVLFIATNMHWFTFPMSHFKNFKVNV